MLSAAALTKAPPVPIGDIHYCYTRDPRALLASLEKHPALTFLHRPTNLEDVFLKLTGHELRD